MSKFGNLISQAKNNVSGNTENQKDGKPEKQETVKIAEREVNLSIKVPERLRRHWTAEAKRSGTSITAEVTAALNKKFGTPDNQ
ncbi:MAG TPA: hypothetical protein VGC76_12465 [Pyrinomonadaceae bacterium]|jgi:hypothetical protein